MSLAPVPSEQPGAAPSCANCSAPLVPDQRYCLACGRPVSPIRLSFLDVLQTEPQPYGAVQAPVAAIPTGYASVIEPAAGPYAWLRRYSGLFGLLSVLLLAIVAGLLVGHWVTQSRTPSRQVLRVEGLGALAAPQVAATATTASGATPATAPTSTTSAPASKSAAKTEAHEAREAKAIEKAPPPKAVKVNSTKLHKLGTTTGQKHEEEVNSLGAQPIETG